MKPSTAKDKVLKAAIGRVWVDCEDLSNELNIEFETVYWAALELEKRGHVAVKKTSTIGHPRALRLNVLPPGEHFSKNHKYRNEAIKEWFKELPKVYWILVPVIGYLMVEGAKKGIEYLNNRKDKPKSEQVQPSGPKQSPKQKTP